MLSKLTDRKIPLFQRIRILLDKSNILAVRNEIRANKGILYLGSSYDIEPFLVAALEGQSNFQYEIQFDEHSNPALSKKIIKDNIHNFFNIVKEIKARIYEYGMDCTLNGIINLMENKNRFRFTEGLDQEIQLVCKTKYNSLKLKDINAEFRINLETANTNNKVTLLNSKL
ncbi:MAG: hypothetical protein J0H68_02120 [Sphingobacteriia bacterium]|nr:hypothetical protein [Sphingobacteriia bacterium]